MTFARKPLVLRDYSGRVGQTVRQSDSQTLRYLESTRREEAKATYLEACDLRENDSQAKAYTLLGLGEVVRDLEDPAKSLVYEVCFHTHGSM